MFAAPGLGYKTAGNLAIYPENSLADVEQFAKLMKLDLAQEFCLGKNENYKGRKAQMPIPVGKYTIKEALVRFVDFLGPLSKKVVKEFAQKCLSEKDKEE